ncbi:MAG: Nuclease inhibitor-like protein [Blastocatellia bacterium]|jgi:hypothetical protein|nr:Nuclease inhibitor-like protein [Blastocatellia bacterium]
MPDQDSQTPKLAVNLSKAFQALASDVYLVSESDYGYKAFAAAMPKETGLDEESFRAALKIGSRYTIDMRPADDFFEQYKDAGNNEEDTVAAYTLLEKVMRDTLSDLRTVYVRGENVVNVRFFLFGRTDDGSLAGLKSTSIET